MRVIRRLFPWTLRLGVLAAVGIFVFVLVRYRPRCTIRGDLDVRAVSADGSLILTQRKAEPKTRVKAALQVWNGHTGKGVHYLLEDVVSIQLGLDGRHGVGILPGGEVRLFDWQAAAEWPVRGVTAASIERAQFSPQGRWLALAGLFDTKLVSVARPPAVQDLYGTHSHFSADDRFAFTDRWRDPGPRVYHLDPFEPTGMALLWDWQGYVADTSADGSLLALKTDRWERAGPNTFKRTPLTRVWNLEVVRPSLPEVNDKRFRDLLEQPRLNERFRLEHFAHLIAGHEGAEHRRRFSPCSRYLAAWLPNYPALAPLEIVETHKGRRVTTFNTKHIQNGGFSGDGSLFWLLHGEAGLLTVLDVASGKVRWEMPCGDVLCFCPAPGALICRASQDDVPALVDVSTGKRRGTLPEDFTITGDFHIATPGGGRLALPGAMTRTRPPEPWEKWLEGWLPELFAAHRPGVLVLDTSSGTTCFRVLCRDYEQVWLSADGRTLVTVHRDAATGQTAARVWDVEPRQAWLWAAGSAGTAASAWLVARFCRLRRARTSAA
jgi:hypothetical protein